MLGEQLENSLHLRSPSDVQKFIENAQQMVALDFQLAALLENQ